MMRSLQPKAAALHTRYKPEKADFAWYIERGQLCLFKEMEEIYRTLLASRDDENPKNQTRGNVPLLAVIIGQKAGEKRIGALVGQMPTARTEPRIIYDTLYLEFEEKDKQAALSSIATLFYTYDNNDEFEKYGQYEKPFLTYAEERLYPGTENKDRKMEDKIREEIVPNISLQWDETIEPFTQNESWKSSEVAVPSSIDSRKKCARYLKTLAEAETLPESLVLFSTGRVGKDQLQQYADKHTGKTLIMLTLSETVQDEVDLRKPPEKRQEFKEDLKQKVEELSDSFRKHIPEPLESIAQNIPESVKKWFGLAIILAFGSVIWFFMLDRTPPQLASLMLQSSNLMQAAQTPLPRFGDFGKAQLAFSEAVQGVALSNQACEKTDDTAKTWNCAVALSSDNPNQAETLTLAVADVKDEAGNVMKPATFTAQIESAEIHASPVAQWKFSKFASLILLNATAKYGVASVRLNNVEMVRINPKLWGAILPNSDDAPLTAVIRDAHENEIRVRLP